MSASLSEIRQIKQVPTNTFELFIVLEMLTSSELRVLDSLIYVADLKDNSSKIVKAALSTIAENSGCSTRTVKRFERKYNHILFTKKTIKKGKENMPSKIIFEPWIRQELTALKALLKHISAFPDYRQSLSDYVFCYELSFKDLISKKTLKGGRVTKSSKLFISPSYEQANVPTPPKNKNACKIIKSNDLQKVMNNLGGSNGPDTLLYINNNDSMQTRGVQSLRAPRLNPISETLERYQMLDYISRSKQKEWNKKFSSSQLIEAINKLCQAITHRRIKKIEKYLEKILTSKTSKAKLKP